MNPAQTIRDLNRIGQVVRCTTHGRTAIVDCLKPHSDKAEQYLLGCSCTYRVRPAAEVRILRVACRRCGTPTSTTSRNPGGVLCASCARIAAVSR